MYDSCGVRFLSSATYCDLYVGREEVSSCTTYAFNDGRIVGIKSLLDVVWITAAHIYVNAAQLELVLLRDFKENMLSVYYYYTKLVSAVNIRAEVNAASENMLEVNAAGENMLELNAASENMLEITTNSEYQVNAAS
ncbi:hypothetical protein Tco_1282709 [Tanacetum coccineum]